MSSSEEKVYLDTEAHLVTSKRLVIKQTGKTLLMDEVRDPRTEWSPLKSEIRFNPIDFVWDMLAKSYLKTASFHVVVTYRGSSEVVAQQPYAVGSADRMDRFVRLYPEEVHGSKEFEVRKRDLLALAESIGAAVARV